MCNIHWNGWCITWGTQPERRVLRLESRSYNKSCPRPKAYYFSKVVGQKLFLVVSKPCLTFLSSVAYHSLSPKCTPWFAPIIESYSCDFTSAFTWSLCLVGAHASLMLSKYPTCCRATFEPCCHNLTCVLVYSSCFIIQTNDASNRVWSSFRSRSLYPSRRCPLLTSACKEVIFDLEHLTKLLGQED
jgi:hypothetical protein